MSKEAKSKMAYLQQNQNWIKKLTIEKLDNYVKDRMKKWND
jgi:hypothetical protein